MVSYVTALAQRDQVVRIFVTPSRIRAVMRFKRWRAVAQGAAPSRARFCGCGFHAPLR